MASVGAARRAELRAMLIALAVLALVVASFAAAASSNDPASTIEAGAGSDDDAGGVPQSDGSATVAEVSTEHGEEHGEEHAEGADDVDADVARQSNQATAKAPAATPTAPCSTTKALVATAGEHGDHAATTTVPPATTTTTTATATAAPCAQPANVPAANAPPPNAAPTTAPPASTGDTTPTTVHGEHGHSPAPAGDPTTPTTAHDGGHSHDPGPPTTGGTTPTTQPHDPCAVSAEDDGGHGGHGDGPNIQMTELQQCYPTVAAQISAVTAEAVKLPTGNLAKAAGWTPATLFFPGIAAHYMVGGTGAAIGLDSVFDPMHPEVLLYGRGSNPPLVGINYIVKSGALPPEGFEGDWDVWHEHQWLCVQLPPLPLLVVGESNDGVCPSGQYAYPFQGHWLLHVWSIPGWDAPEGLFSHENSKVL